MKNILHKTHKPAHQRVLLMLSIIATSIILTTVSSFATAQGEGGNASLTPGFWPDPIVLTYYSGGNDDAAAYGESCAGRVASVPDHIITVTEALDYLRIYVESDVDTTLMVRQVSTDEVVCNDDLDDLNPGLEWEFVPIDVYHVYVGNYHENDALTEYTLYITEFEPQ